MALVDPSQLDLLKPRSTQRFPKGKWVDLGKQRFYARSTWEANYGRYLEWLKHAGEIKSWRHEPKTFWFSGLKRGVVSYKPDYRIDELDGSHWWAEVKGYMDHRSAVTLKRMGKYFPEEKIRVIDKSWFSCQQWSSIVPGWETVHDLRGIPGICDALRKVQG